MSITAFQHALHTPCVELASPQDALIEAGNAICSCALRTDTGYCLLMARRHACNFALQEAYLTEAIHSCKDMSIMAEQFDLSG